MHTHTAHGDDFPVERALLGDALAGLRSHLHHIGQDLVVLDMRQGCSEAEAASSVSELDVVVRLEDIRQCWAVVALVGESYGAQLPATVATAVSRKEGWEWLEALAGRSLTETDVTAALRFLYADDLAVTRRCLVYLKAEESGRAGMVMEDEERVVLQQQLIADLLSHREHHCHKYTTAQDGVSKIAAMLLAHARTDFGGAGSSHISSRAPTQQKVPFGMWQVQTALHDSIALDLPLPSLPATMAYQASSPSADTHAQSFGDGGMRSEAAERVAAASRLSQPVSKDSDHSIECLVLQPGQALFWETYLGLQAAPEAGAAGAVGEAACPTDGQLDYEAVLDRFLYYKPPPPPAAKRFEARTSGRGEVVAGDDDGPPPLVLAGPCGSGKSALLRRWTAHVGVRTAPRVTTVLSYFGTDSSFPQPGNAPHPFGLLSLSNM